jgi:hypothetical protein
MLLRVKKVKIGRQSPKTEFLLKYLYCCVISLYELRKNLLLGVKKTKISLEGTNMDFGAQNQYDRVSIDPEFYIDEENTRCFGRKR